MTDPVPDYKALLILYMAHVIDCEGDSLLDDYDIELKYEAIVIKQLKDVEGFAAAMIKAA